MYKLVVFSALLAVAVAAPGHLLGHSAIVAAPLATVHAAPIAHAIPAAVSHQSRVDVIKPVARIAYAAPAVVHAPVVHAAPVAVAHAAPLALGHHGLAYGHGLSYGHGLALGHHGVALAHHY